MIGPRALAAKADRRESHLRDGGPPVYELRIENILWP